MKADQRKNWEIVHECNDVENNPTCWALKINHRSYGRYVWISQYGDADYTVEVIPYGETIELVHCKSLTSAKRWVTMNLL